MSGQNVPNHYFTEYSRNLDFLLQKMQCDLRRAVSTGNHSGDKASPVDQIGKVEMSDVVARFQPMARTDSPLARRWVFPISSDLPQYVDTFDKLKLILDPTGSYTQNAHFASERRIENHIITGFFADAKTGVSGGDTETFGTTLESAGGQNVSVGIGGAASGLNVAKIKRGRKRLKKNHVPRTEQIYCAITAEEEEDLLNEIEIISLDFNEKPVLVDGHVKRFLGVEFMESELLQTGTDDAAGTSTAVPMWTKKGMYYGNWQSTVTDIAQRKDLQGLPWQIYLMQTGGATRLEKERVVRIWCR